MIYTIIDTETSGLPPRDKPFDFSGVDILSYAFIQCDKEYNVIRSGIRYMWEDNYSWSEEAYKVNGLDKLFLKQNCGDMRTNYEELYCLVSRGNLITYNGTKFDIPLINSFLRRHAVEPDGYERNIDCMNFAKSACGNGRLISLVNTCKKLEIDEEFIQAIQEGIFGEASRPHDASYDVTATLLCLQRFEELGYVEL